MNAKNQLTVLILGSGGREHAMAHSVRQSLRCSRLLVSPGNGGMPGEQRAVAADDVPGIVALCQAENVDLVLIGPESSLAAGVVDALNAIGVKAFGPTQQLAEIESSKVFSRELAACLGIPGPRFATFSEGDSDAAIAWWRELDAPVVVKQSGLAGGKGVVVPTSDDHTRAAIVAACEVGPVVLEEMLKGPECSLMAMCDGALAVPLPMAQDHKRIGEGDVGANTGGMGAYAPAVVPYSADELSTTFIQPIVDYFARKGTPYKGVLYAGLMLTKEGPRLLEYNCRFGDPEAQVLLSLLSTDVVELALACVDGTLKPEHVKTKPVSAHAVVMTSAHYPETPRLGDVITGLEHVELHTNVFHGGTKQVNGALVTNGGRVVTVVGVGPDLESARGKTYARVQRISFAGSYFRRDIAWRAPGNGLTSYSAAGVNIDEGNRAVELLKKSVASTSSDNVLRGIGAFGGALDVSFLKEYDQPVLVASTDGVGTKVELAARENRVHGTGIDIVNHCINDVLVQGARPLFFLDYIASSKINAEMVADVVSGMSEACAAGDCVLLGGETAEMPGVYAPGAFDIAGTLVGVVDKKDLLPREGVGSGDVLIGLASNGPHTNGYSLLRRILDWLPLDVAPPPLTRPLIDELLMPHRSYLNVLTPVLKNPSVKALVHITGGGLVENLPRVFPEGVSATVHTASWPKPPLFEFIESVMSLETEELYRTLNMGIGMVLVVAPENAEQIRSLIDEETWVIGVLQDQNGDSSRVILR
ncbi:MAG: phosphoribosylamine--glycine ligase [Ilumatobacteraceae bacterium]|jgi:phosphoribosylamine--glycine ligase/phosphoribosylaminoimidazole synthetase|nr:phosphoribosylamine--glycine ligase [Ilumatobacteraceae bacterium]